MKFNSITSQNKFLELFTSFSNSDKTLYLVDTGSDVCLIKKQYLKGETICFPGEKLRLHGITNDVITTLGSCTAKIQLTESIFIDQIFHIVPDDFPLVVHGIIGYDFLSNHNCFLNFSDYSLQFSELNVKLPLSSHFYDTEVPARSEKTILMLLDVDCDNEYLCRSNEISKGVFVANTIVRSVEKYAAINVININDSAVSLKNHILNVNPISDFKLFPINNWTNNIENRLQFIESQINTEDLNNEEKSSIQKICKEYNDVFFVEGDSLSMTNATMHSIPIPENANPVNVKPYRLPESMKEIISSEVSSLLNNNIIRPSTSPWNSPLLVVPKKSIDGERKYRVVVDY